ncbi:unnamed protein product [Boreogadus saida]
MSNRQSVTPVETPGMPRHHFCRLVADSHQRGEDVVRERLAPRPGPSGGQGTPSVGMEGGGYPVAGAPPCRQGYGSSDR